MKLIKKLLIATMALTLLTNIPTEVMAKLPDLDNAFSYETYSNMYDEYKGAAYMVGVDGTVYASGKGVHGTVSSVTTTGEWKPVKRNITDSGLDSVVHITTSPRATYAVTEDGTIYGWGLRL